MKTKIISVLNLKGGVGKTTTALNLAKAVANTGKKVLLIDLDPQMSLTTNLGLFSDAIGVKNINSLLVDKETLEETNFIQKLKLNDCIYEREENLDLIPSSFYLVDFNQKNINRIKREFVLQKALQDLNKMNYDYVFIDNNPALNILMQNSLAVSDYILIPTKLAPLSLPSISFLLMQITKIKNELNENLKVLGIVPTFHDGNNESKETFNDLKEIYEGSIKVFDTFIRQNVKLKEAPKNGMSIFKYCPKSHGAEDYNNLSIEVLKELPNA